MTACPCPTSATCASLRDSGMGAALELEEHQSWIAGSNSSFNGSLRYGYRIGPTWFRPEFGLKCGHAAIIWAKQLPDCKEHLEKSERAVFQAGTIRDRSPPVFLNCSPTVSQKHPIGGLTTKANSPYTAVSNVGNKVFHAGMASMPLVIACKTAQKG